MNRNGTVIAAAVGIAPKSDGTNSRRMGPVDATVKRVFAGGRNRYPALGIKAGVSIPTAEGEQAALIGGKKEITETLSVNGGIRWGIAGDSPHVTYLLGLTYGYRRDPPVPAAAPVREAR